jgi:two-component system KDP operon response regulator KdpE
VSTVLLVEDEAALRHALRRNLEVRGYTVAEAPDGATALALFATEHPDVVVLDLGLPDLDGTHVVRVIRGQGDETPIVVLSARTDSVDKVEALDLGADDYVTKPFDVEELLARLRAVSRRGGETPEPQRFRFGDVEVDLTATTVQRDGERIHLTPNEWHLLAVLLQNPGRLVTGRQLLTAMRGSPEHTDPSYLRIYLAQLRRKLEPVPSRPRYLITEPGLGYRYQP